MTGMLHGFLFTFLVAFAGDVSGNHLTTLTNKLLESYDPTVRPYCPNEKQVVVYLDVVFRQLIGLDEPSQIITVNLWIRMRWNDCLLKWNPGDNDNITYLTIPFDNLWVPDITLFDYVSKEFYGYNDYRAHVRSNGIVSYNFPSTMELQCSIDIKTFPYDKQICGFTFGSWDYDTRDIDLFPMLSDRANLFHLKQHVEWSIEKIPAKRRIIALPGNYSFAEIVYSMHLKRKPEYYEANVISPSVIITLVGAFGFTLPVDSGEKISLQVTVLLSQTVFQLLIADKLPPSIDDRPWLDIYFTFTLYLAGFTTFTQVIAVYIYYLDDKEMSNRTKKYILIPLLYTTFVVTPKRNRNDLVEMDNEVKWQLLSVAVDRLSLAVFVISAASGIGYILYQARFDI